MGIMQVIGRVIPDLSAYFIQDIGKIREPRYMVAGDIDHWIKLREQINPNTGKINSYRNIRRICEVENRTVPSLGTLRNYLGSGGNLRRAEAVGEWRAWFEDFGRISQYYRDEHEMRTSKEEWQEFRTIYETFMGYA